jgi:hypothetical protein
MTWRNAHDFAGSLDAINKLVALVDRQHDPGDAAVDVLQRLVEKVGVEVIVIPKKDSPVTVAEIEAVAEALVELCRRGLDDDDIAEDVQTALMVTRDDLDELNYAHEEWPRPAR